MIIRRYYPKGFKGKTYSEDYLDALEARGVNTRLIDNARVEVLLTPEEQRVWFDQCVRMVLENTRWVLDNLDRLPEFKVGWEDYHRKIYK